jgi:Zn-dependent M28 family amino/carboxypeptidase
LKEAGEPWFLNLREELQPNASITHTTQRELIHLKARDAAKKGAKALFIYNTDESKPDMRYTGNDKDQTLPIPVIFVRNAESVKYFTDEAATLQIKLNIKFTRNSRTGHNILAYLDNGARTTIVLGAHYDHLGMGEEGNSLSGIKEKQIHNGADDNASGIAALLELSKLLKKSRLKNNNYLFIAFSGEEQGLLGSRYFVDNPTINLPKINYMINMDMIGRLNDSSKTLTVGGYGTSPHWAKLITRPKKEVFFHIRYDSSGTGPSDHTSFYRKNIPVLFFFTGLHSDYHKPGDDFNKLNYTGGYRNIFTK